MLQPVNGEFANLLFCSSLDFIKSFNASLYNWNSEVKIYPYLILRIWPFLYQVHV